MMRCVWLWAALPVVLSAADSRIDHVTIAGSDIKRMQAKLASVEIASVYGGAHSNHATEMALVSFPDGSYLELMGITSNAEADAVGRHVWAKFLQENAGPCAWAMREKDLAAEVSRLKAAGVAVSAPSDSGRTRPDGVRLEWETSDIGGETRGTFFPFLIEDKTPREQRAFPQGKPVTKEFRGVTRVVIAVRNLDDAIQRYRQAYGMPRPIKQVDQSFQGYLALLGNLPVVLAQPLNAGSWLAERIERFGEGPCAFVLAAVNPAHFHGIAKTRWFGAEISWFDEEKLGWRLGFEAAR
ncbi:MAG: VOC family protein [Candidatus Solibacter sp.]|jgi:catechol 2,3-dioxygenase-like lactoylglutathione lyase family enzyme